MAQHLHIALSRDYASFLSLWPEDLADDKNASVDTSTLSNRWRFHLKVMCRPSAFFEAHGIHSLNRAPVIRQFISCDTTPRPTGAGDDIGARDINIFSPPTVTH